MVYSGNVLGDGQVQLSATAIYTVPADTRAILTSLVLHNTNEDDTLDVIIQINASGSDQQLWSINLNPLQTVELLDANSYSLGTGDIIKAHTTSGSLKINYVLMGAEEEY